MSIKGLICLDARGIYCHQFRNSKVLELITSNNMPKLILGSKSADEFSILYPEIKKLMVWKRSIPPIELISLAKQNSLDLFIVGGYYTFKSFLPYMESVTILRSLENRDGQIIDNFDFYSWEIISVNGVYQNSDENKMWRVTVLVKKKPKLLQRR